MVEFRQRWILPRNKTMELFRVYWKRPLIPCVQYETTDVHKEYVFDGPLSPGTAVLSPRSHTKYTSDSSGLVPSVRSEDVSGA